MGGEPDPIIIIKKIKKKCLWQQFGVIIFLSIYSLYKDYLNLRIVKNSNNFSNIL
jgi:hypothetical protein